MSKRNRSNAIPRLSVRPKRPNLSFLQTRNLMAEPKSAASENARMLNEDQG
jgi:hypothetical protein